MNGNPDHKKLSSAELESLDSRDLIEIVRKLQKDLSQAEAERVAFIESSYDGYWDWYIQNNYEYMSPRFWEIFGFDHRTKKHDPAEWQDLIFQEDLELALKNFDLHITSRGEHPYNQEVRYKHADGSTVTVLCRGQVIEWNEKGEATRMIGTHTDITPLKRIEEEKEKLIEQLLQSNNELSKFAYICSHDLQEPLRMIRAFTEKLSKQLEGKLEDSEKAQNYFNIITENARRSQDMIDDVLLYSSVDMDKQPPVTVNTNSLVDSIINNLASDGDRETAHITREDLPDLKGQKTQFYQLFQNLIGNGLKYQQPDKTPEIHIGVIDRGPGVRDKRHFWEFYVRDNGIGIEQQYWEKIFQMFNRLHDRTEYPGTGIGLSICQKIVKHYGGEIWLESEVTKGTTFHFTIPGNVDNRA